MIFAGLLATGVKRATEQGRRTVVHTVRLPCLGYWDMAPRASDFAFILRAIEGMR